MIARQLPTAEIVRRQDFTNDLFVMWLAPEITFAFEAGQYVTVGADGIERPYSIASAPYEDLIEIFVEYVPPDLGGRLTPLLYKRSVGDRVTIRPKAKGVFTLQADVSNHVMVATVTGIAPYVSMVRQYLHNRLIGTVRRDVYRFFIMEGASHADELVYDTELGRFSAAYPDVIQYIPSVSRADAPRNARWTGRVGRINLLLEEYLERWELPTDDAVVYLCGHPGMIDDAKRRLLPKGWFLKEERFWRG